MPRAVHCALSLRPVNDCTQADRLLENEHVIADKGYDREGVLRKIEKLDAVAAVPPRSSQKVQREYNRDLYKRHNLIERAFNKLKRFRALPPVTIVRPCTSALFCTWQLPSCGSDSIVDST